MTNSTNVTDPAAKITSPNARIQRSRIIRSVCSSRGV
jgi:hypothetical protein